MLATAGFLAAQFSFGYSSLSRLGLTYMSWRIGSRIGLVAGLVSPFLLYLFVQMFDGGTINFVNQGFGPGAVGLGVVLFSLRIECWARYITLHHAAAPGWPDGYCKAIDGASIVDGVGACGTAAFRNEPVIVEDIETDPLWREFSAFAGHWHLRYLL